MRNIGGNIGTSIVTTVTTRRLQYQQQILVGHLTPAKPAFRQPLHSLTEKVAHFGHSLPDAHRQAIARVYASLDRQAHTRAYMDAYWVLGVFASAMFFLALFLKKNDPGAGGQTAAG
jgi:MFS transporter, DHA2 family, multidrug resistance protein